MVDGFSLRFSSGNSSQGAKSIVMQTSIVFGPNFRRGAAKVSERSLAKLNIRHGMRCNKPINYKMLTKFLLDIIAWSYGQEGNSHILGYPSDFGGNAHRGTK